MYVRVTGNQKTGVLLPWGEKLSVGGSVVRDLTEKQYQILLRVQENNPELLTVEALPQTQEQQTQPQQPQTQPDYSTWTREELKAEYRRRFGKDPGRRRSDYIIKDLMSG